MDPPPPRPCKKIVGSDGANYVLVRYAARGVHAVKCKETKKQMFQASCHRDYKRFQIVGEQRQSEFSVLYHYYHDVPPGP